MEVLLDINCLCINYCKCTILGDMSFPSKLSLGGIMSMISYPKEVESECDEDSL